MDDEDGAPTGALFVALPTPEDAVNAYSEEERAHVTLLWFGDAADLMPDEVDALRAHAQTVASATMPFTANVNGRAVLGTEDAGVLLLESAELVQLRVDLFDDPTVQALVERATQFPWWIPHLTATYGKGLPGPGAPDTVTFGGVGLWLAGQHEAFPFAPPPLIDESETDALLSAGVNIPPVLTAADLPLCIAHADRCSDARWYATKRAAALGLEHMIPSGWGAA